MAFTTYVKLQLNTLLKPIGLEVGTTLKRRTEAARIQRLQSVGHWTKPRYDEGLDINPERNLEFLRRNCAPYRSDYLNFPRSSNGDVNQFHLNNGWFGEVDAELLYGIIRQQKPQKVFEVGSGFSTRLMLRAIRDENLSTAITSVDPEPRVAIAHCVTEHLAAPVEHVDPARIIDYLDEGDLLFIDSSHCITTGGDVPYLLLEVLPKLKKGVLIQIHDIFLPFDYPEEWVSAGWGWGEQYLVHGFLCYNDVFEILWPARYMWEYYQPAVLDLIPADANIFPPSSLWLKKLR